MKPCLLLMLSLALPCIASAQQPFSNILSSGQDSYYAGYYDLKPEKDSLTPDQRRAKRIALHSAIIPGWGQFNNKKYWKIPLIYGGAVGLGLVIDYNNDLYQVYKKTVIIRLTGDTISEDPRPNATLNAAISARDAYRRSRDFSIIVSAILYLLNIADAYVDAHLSTFDVSDDLSMVVGQPLQPNLGNIAPPSQVTMTLKINLGK